MVNNKTLGLNFVDVCTKHACVHQQFACISQGEVKMQGIHHPVSVSEVAET